MDAGVPPEAGRSAWNEAGTWEEVEKTDWCKERITRALRCALQTVLFAAATAACVATRRSLLPPVELCIHVFFR